MEKLYSPKSVYIHIPFCKSKCIYCGFFSKPPAQYDIQKLLNAELKELKNSSLKKPSDTLYIGGGSPASIDADALCDFLSEVTKLTGDPEEFTIELNPADVDEIFLKKLFDVGINRVSFGVQSFDDNELVFLGRRYTAEKAQEKIKIAKTIGFKNIGIDLIFAIPGSSLQSWQQTLSKAIENDVQHLSTYSLTYETNTPLDKIKSAGKLKIIDEETDRKMYETTIETLAAAGFEQYEISNFAKPGLACKHNLTYWQNERYIGIGPAACAYIKDYRLENISDIVKYIETIEQDKEPAVETVKISPQELACQTAVIGLRLIKGIDLAEYKQKTGFDIFDLFKISIEKNLKSSLLQIKNNCLSLTKSALPIADTVLSDFSQPD